MELLTRFLGSDRRMKQLARSAWRAFLWSLLATAVLVLLHAAGTRASGVVGVLGDAALALSVGWFVLMLVATGIIWWRMGRARWGIFAPEARRARLAALYIDAHRQTLESGVYLVRVRRVYQVARRGTKCIVEHQNGALQDAWFWASRPRRGWVVVVRGQGAWGPHTGHLNVLYVGTAQTGNGILWRIPRAVWRVRFRA
jgi:hypothetical protein